MYKKNSIRFLLLKYHSGSYMKNNLGVGKVENGRHLVHVTDDDCLD